MSNLDQVDYWNNEGGALWASKTRDLDRLLAPFTDILSSRLALNAGDHALDIGCGGGDLTLRLANDVGASGSVIGLDISRPLLAAARERAAGHVPQADFIEGDAANWRPKHLCDAVASRFGVMFFEDPVAAFENIRACLSAGGRLAFVCWQGLQQNTWLAAPMAAVVAHLDKKPEPADPSAPGPFAFADRNRIEGILQKSGWRDIRVASWRSVLTMPGATMDDTKHFLTRMGPAGRLVREHDIDLTVVHSAIHDFLVSRTDADGAIRLGAAAWIVDATA